MVHPTLLVAALALVAGSLSCADAPTGPKSTAEFVAADHVGRDGAGPGLALLNLNGQYRRIGGPAGDPVWLPDRERVAYWRLEQSELHVWIAEVASGTEHHLIPSGGPLLQERSSQADPQGQWLYVMGCASANPCDFELWRVSVSGADAGRTAERVPVAPPVGGTAIVLRVEDVARDGRLLIEYATQSLATGVTRVLLGALDPATGAITDLPVYGQSARWSPDGRLIAYLDSFTLVIARSDDGTMQMRFSPYQPGLSWSQDGRFVLVRAVGGVNVIDVARQTATPLAFAGALYEPAWRPW